MTEGGNQILIAIGEKVAYAALNYEFCHQRPPLYQREMADQPIRLFSRGFWFRRSADPRHHYRIG